MSRRKKPKAPRRRPKRDRLLDEALRQMDAAERIYNPKKPARPGFGHWYGVIDDPKHQWICRSRCVEPPLGFTLLSVRIGFRWQLLLVDRHDTILAVSSTTFDSDESIELRLGAAQMKTGRPETDVDRLVRRARTLAREAHFHRLAGEP